MRQNRDSENKHYWTVEEDEKLKRLVEKHGAKKWKVIAG